MQAHVSVDIAVLLMFAHRSYTGPVFAATSPARRVATASILLLLVSTIIPYQFAFLVACIVQMTTCTRALRLARDTVSVNRDIDGEQFADIRFSALQPTSAFIITSILC